MCSVEMESNIENVQCRNGKQSWGAACHVVGLARRHDLHYVTTPIRLPATPIVLLVACVTIKCIPFMLLSLLELVCNEVNVLRYFT